MLEVLIKSYSTVKPNHKTFTGLSFKTNNKKTIRKQIKGFALIFQQLHDRIYYINIDIIIVKKKLEILQY